MAAINRIIVNPWFLLLFMGTAACCVALTFLVWGGEREGRVLILSGCALYLGGIIGITAAVNVPLDERLEKALGNVAEARDLWPEYLRRWTPWNSVRAFCGMLAAALFALAV